MDGHPKPQTHHRGIVSIRAYRRSDTEDLQRAANHAEVSRNLRDGFPFPYTMDDARWWIDRCVDSDASGSNETRTFAIALDDVVVGGIGFVENSPEAKALSSENDEDARGGPEEEVGYWLAPSEWGKGIATRALELLVARARKGDLLKNGCQTIVALPDVENHSSRRVLEYRGFVARQGELVDVAIKGNRTSRSVVYQLVL